MKDVLLRLTSRKFLLALAAFIAAAANGEWNAAIGIVIAYLGVEGGSDLAEKFTK